MRGLAARVRARIAPVFAALAAVTAAQPAGAQSIRVLEPVEAFRGEPFTLVRGLHELADGLLLITDQRENAVWRVDLARGTREKVGREGSGPDEYRQPIGLMPFRGDSIALQDLGNGRLAILGPDLRMGRTMSMFAITGTIAGWTDTQGRLYADRISEVRMARVRDPRASDQAALFRVAEANPARADTIAHLTVAGPPNPQVWYPWDAWAAGADGRVLVVRNQKAYRVEWFLPDGRSVRGPVLETERLPVTPEDRRIWTEEHPRGAGGVAAGGTQAPKRPPPADFPDVFPFADPRDVHVDAEGRGWIGRHEHQRETRPLFDVIGADGRRIAQVRLPPGRAVVGFGPGSLYAVRKDDVELQWLERYDIRSIR